MSSRSGLCLGARILQSRMGRQSDFPPRGTLSGNLTLRLVLLREQDLTYITDVSDIHIYYNDFSNGRKSRALRKWHR